MIYLLAVLIGVVAGLRTMTAPAVIAWAVAAGWLPLAGSPLAFLGFKWTPWILSVLAVGELIVDKLPSTPSRTIPGAFAARIVSGGLCGAALGAAHGSLWMGAGAGIAGAIVGTLGGRAGRGWLAAKLDRDWPAAIVEDAIAVGGAILVVASVA